MMNSSTHSLADSQSNVVSSTTSDPGGFEVAAAMFLEDYHPGDPEMSRKLQEISRLLSASSDNLAEMREQKWFQRAWATVTRSNKKLTERNQQNLLAVQQGAFEFLDYLAKQSPLAREAVLETLKRVEDNQIQNERLKAHLLKAIQKVSQRNSEFEERQAAIEEWARDHQRIDHPVDRGHSRVYWLILAIICAFGAAVIPVVWPKTTSAWIAAGVLGITAFVVLLIWLLKSRPDAHPSSLLCVSVGEAEHITEMQSLRLIKHNRTLRPNLRTTIEESMTERYTEGVIASILLPLNECLAVVDSAFEKLPDDPAPKEYAAFIKALLSVPPDVLPLCRQQSLITAGQVVDDANELLKAMAGCLLGRDYLGAVIASESGKQHEQVLSDELYSTLLPIEQHLEGIEALRADLAQKYSRWEKVVTENTAKAVGKAFLKGFFVIPALLDDEREFMTETNDTIESLIGSWGLLVETRDSGVKPLIRKTIESGVRDIVTLWDPLWCACDDAQISLEGADVSWRSLLG